MSNVKTITTDRPYKDTRKESGEQTLCIQIITNYKDGHDNNGSKVNVH